MKLTRTILICLLLAAPGLPAADEAGFRSLFNGKDLEGWRIVDKRGPGWGVENGMLVCLDLGGGKVLTKEEYANFTLRFEYRLAEGGNNGVNIRAAIEGRPAYVGMEIQILDDLAPKWKEVRSEQRNGSIYNLLPARTGYARKPGEWNEMEITAEGRRVRVILNGVIVLDANLDIIREPELLGKHPGLARASGHLGFLGHQTRCEFRNIRVKRLP